MKLRHFIIIAVILSAIGVAWLVKASYERRETSKTRLKTAQSESKSLIDRYSTLSGFEAVKPGLNGSHCEEAGLGITLKRVYNCSLKASVVYTSRSQPNLAQVQQDLTKELQQDHAKDIYHPSKSLSVTGISAGLEAYGNWQSQYYLSGSPAREQSKASIMVLKPQGLESYDPEYWGSNETGALLKQVKGQDISDMYSMIILISNNYDRCESIGWPCGLLLTQ